ncbi:MAG: BON domain-containing protein [bacterium]
MFEHAVKTVREEDIAESIICGPEARRHLEGIQRFVDPGYDHVYVHQVGPDASSVATKNRSCRRFADPKDEKEDHHMAKNHWYRAALVAALVLGIQGTALAAPDAWVTTKVKLALLTTDGVSSTRINVDTIDGRVTLHGTVPSADEKGRAEQVAASVTGVSKVRNLLTVKPSPETKRAEVTDANLKAAVADALKRDKALADSRIEVASAEAGVVTLNGSATTMSDQLEAVETARNVPGVKRVADAIQGPETLSDAEIWERSASATGSAVTTSATDMWITSAVKVSLIANDQTPGGEINVDTDNGVVTLFGMVPSDSSRRAAEKSARAVKGVKNVTNELQVVAEQKQDAVKESDEQIKSRVEKRVDDDVIAHSDIKVEVSSGVVRLTGTVPSQGDRMQALTLARATSGVRSVVDQLTIAAD